MVGNRGLGPAPAKRCAASLHARAPHPADQQHRAARFNLTCNAAWHPKQIDSSTGLVLQAASQCMGRPARIGAQMFGCLCRATCAAMPAQLLALDPLQACNNCTRPLLRRLQQRPPLVRALLARPRAMPPPACRPSAAPAAAAPGPAAAAPGPAAAAPGPTAAAAAPPGRHAHYRLGAGHVHTMYLCAPRTAVTLGTAFSSGAVAQASARADRCRAARARSAASETGSDIHRTTAGEPRHDACT
jgi:hypothetical protein